MRFEYRIIRYKPAVTRVEEWTNAEIGVGAAIARGSHGENGKMALLVIKVKVKKRVIREGTTKGVNQDPREGEENIINGIVIKNKQSPIRFIRTVNRPEVIELWFW